MTDDPPERRADARNERLSRPGRDPEPSRDKLGRWRWGTITRFEAAPGERGVELTIQQEYGSAHHFIVSPDARQVPTHAGWLQSGALDWVVMGGVALSLGLFRLCTDTKPAWSVVIGFGLVVAALAGTSFYASRWIQANPRFHICPDAEFLPEVVAGAGDPRDAAWAKQALAGLREGQFCRDSRDLHRWIDQLRPDRRVLRDPLGQLRDVLHKAARTLTEHDRPHDGEGVLRVADLVAQWPTAQQETARQAAQTIVDSYQLLDRLPADTRGVVPAGGVTTPTQDAEATITAALRGLAGVAEVDADSDIAALQALRIYSNRWNVPPDSQ